MTMELDADSYVVGLWFVWWDGGDWLMQVYKRNVVDSNFLITYRFRYEEGRQNGPFDHEDRKSWYKATAPGPEDALIEQCTSAAKHVAEGRTTLMGQRAEFDSLIIRGDVKKLLAIAASANKPWFHMKQEEKG